MDLKKIEKGIRLILEGVGEDPERAGLRETPERVAKMYEEIFIGLKTPTEELLKAIEGESHDEMVLLKDISFYSVCEHHLLPFIGTVHVAYIPSGGKIVGLSELVKAVEVLAKRPQVQERLTTQLADLIMDRLKPKGAMVIIDAEHLCISMRGVKKPGSRTVTSAVRGIFRTKQSTREELLELIKRRE
ncbi:MAG: GTP cyclohydrolase I FolE [Nitrospirae bacterium CG_4_10_14_0_8_um_filter_41_23]|nr:GTP cyclohydrolase I FolE [Nitrospirota bacterium]OIP60678.1 MAG: GTP cyclohydrolase I FolE [Nitrospirae bacterium CG2_30_41_42]PIQ93074.1 MAG: GTP cyclohydrolase I FolE [Nitrospirae bacterium CG11_big_fil_rev_8_21_14_0_20_41_14]PIV43770.1 MAG: GTP cyclohydrolase I FolE [Nitrospirae bacterium CG02_land_8_20_14_3_00_41_53]PIW87887.1 MAG: GTP cyclohydrolase I FolE [Nitrospirae bacterium CG_4_8_14_3_um_filter_41_47]PIY86620.1 MAG: GTP cyclohydrolase I FolE [Nitrospirae bacterium CG_4_10_14_0_8